MQSYEFDYSQYRKKINQPKHTSLCLLSFLIIICMGLAMFLYPNSIKKNEYYFVEINSFLTYSEANNLGNLISSVNGAGYVYYDGKYHVFAAFYPSKEDAETVCENLKPDYPTCSVYTLKCDKFHKIKDLTENQNKSVENLLNANISLMNSVYKCIINYDTNEINYNQLLLNLENIKSDYQKFSEEFFNQFNAITKYNKAKKYVTKIVEFTEFFDELKSEQNEQTVSKLLKYKLIGMVINHSSLLESF